MKILPNGFAVIEGDSHHANWVAEQGLIHDPWMAGIISDRLNNGSVVVEGGANIGTLTRPMLNRGARVFAFEPNPEAAACLRYNCPDSGLEIIQKGLSDANRKARINLLENAGASFLDDYGDLEVECVRMDDYLGSKLSTLHLIKLDVEGYEVRAIKGAYGIIDQYHPVMIIEVNQGALSRVGSSDEKLISILRSVGYTWKILQNDLKFGSPQFDIIATPK